MHGGVYMAATNLNIRTDKDINDKEEAILNEHGIPFKLKLEVPDETTEKAIEEGRKLIADPNAPRYSSIEALKKELEV